MNHSLDQIIEANFGKETLDEAASISKGLFATLKDAIGQISQGPGSSHEKQQRLNQYLAMWHDFLNGLFSRTSTTNNTSPEIVETAIKVATSLLSVERGREEVLSVRDMLKNQLGIRE